MSLHIYWMWHGMYENIWSEIIIKTTTKSTTINGETTEITLMWRSWIKKKFIRSSIPFWKDTHNTSYNNRETNSKTLKKRTYIHMHMHIIPKTIPSTIIQHYLELLCLALFCVFECVCASCHVLCDWLFLPAIVVDVVCHWYFIQTHFNNLS